MKAARIVVLLVAVVAGGLAAMLAGRSNDPPPEAPAAPVVSIDTTDVLVATKDVGVGHLVSSADFEWKAWPTSSVSENFVRRNNKPTAKEELAGAITRSPFAVGEPIREARLIKAKGSGFMAAILPSGMRAISTDVTPETGAAGFILPNDRVDVILTRRDREAEAKTGTEVQTSETILSSIRVLAIDQTVEEKDGQRNVIGKTATLEVTPAQAETLVLSRQLGSLSLALRSLLDADKPVVMDEKRDRGELTVTRFGITTTTTTK